MTTQWLRVLRTYKKKLTTSNKTLKIFSFAGLLWCHTLLISARILYEQKSIESSFQTSLFRTQISLRYQDMKTLLLPRKPSYLDIWESFQPGIKIARKTIQCSLNWHTYISNWLLTYQKKGASLFYRQQSLLLYVVVSKMVVLDFSQI